MKYYDPFNWLGKYVRFTTNQLYHSESNKTVQTKSAESQFHLLGATLIVLSWEVANLCPRPAGLVLAGTKKYLMIVLAWHAGWWTESSQKKPQLLAKYRLWKIKENLQKCPLNGTESH